MWDFLTRVLEQAGFVAALYVLTLLGVAFAFRAMWQAQVKAQALVAETQKCEAAKRAEMYRTFEDERTSMRKDFAAELAEARKKYANELRQLQELRSAGAAEFAKRLDEVQERRVAEMRDLTSKAVGHIASIDQTVGKLGAAVDVLIRMTDGGR